MRFRHAIYFKEHGLCEYVETKSRVLVRQFSIIIFVSDTSML